ncbi:MAG: hypothetical protein HY812_11510 [Planctomycetes bacterium]|nr:hypothetical protein [Planctomycetota bacterium]
MKRATKSILTILVFAVGLSYFGFTLFFFDPFEGSYQDDFADSPIALEFVVPRNIDYFVHKRSLQNDFDQYEFPIPYLWDRVRLTRNWQKLESTPLYEQAAGQLDLAAKVEKVRAAVSRVPLLDPLADLLGRDAAVFGRLGGRVYKDPETAAVFLGSALAKFAYEVAGYGALRSLFGMPFAVEEDERGVRSITLEDGTRIHVYRRQDLFVVGNGPLLVREVVDLLDLGREGREGSLGRLRRYNVTVAQQEANEFAGVATNQQLVFEQVDERLQLHADLPAMLSLVDFDEAFLEPRGEVSRWLLARLFSPRYYKDCTLDVGFGDVLDLRSMVGFNREAAEAAESGFYDRRTFELRKAMDEAAALVPEDTYFLMAARVDMQKFLPKLLAGLTEVDPAARELMDELIAAIRRMRPDFRAGNSMEAARYAATLLGQDVVVALKRDTYFGPPENPAPLVGIFLQVKERGPDFEELEKAQGNPQVSTGYNGFIFPIQKAHNNLKQQERGVCKWYRVWHEKAGSPNERFVQDVVLIGTGIRNVSFGIIDPRSQTEGPWTLAVVMSPRAALLESAEGGAGENEWRGTAHEMITDFIKLSVSGGAPTSAPNGYTKEVRMVRSLRESRKYQEGREFLQGFASVAVYLDFARWKEVLFDGSLAYAEQATELDTEEWQEVARGVRQHLLDGEFAAWRGKEMPAAVKERFDRAVEAQKAAIDRERLSTAVPQRQRDYEESLAWVDFFRDAFLAARIEETGENIELRARIRTQLD